MRIEFGASLGYIVTPTGNRKRGGRKGENKQEKGKKQGGEGELTCPVRDGH